MDDGMRFGAAVVLGVVLASPLVALGSPPELLTQFSTCHVQYEVIPAPPTGTVVEGGESSNEAALSATGGWEYSCDGTWRRVQGTPIALRGSTSAAVGGAPAAFSASTNGVICLLRTADLSSGALSDIVYTYDARKGDGMPAMLEYSFDRLALGISCTDESERPLSLRDMDKLGTRTDVPGGGAKWAYRNSLGWAAEADFDPQGILRQVKSTFAPSPNAMIEWTTTFSEVRTIEGRQVPWKFRRVKTAGGGSVVLEDLTVVVQGFDCSSRALVDFPPVPAEEAMMKESPAGATGVIERPGMTAADYDARM